MREAMLCAVVALLVGGCSVTENARALGARVDDRVRLNLDARDFHHRQALELAREECQIWQDQVAAVRVMCGGRCAAQHAAAVAKARQCHQDAMPPIVGLKGYVQELREVRKAIRGQRD